MHNYASLIHIECISTCLPFFIHSSPPHKNTPKSNLSPLPAVPNALVTILENILQKLVEWNLLDKEFTGPDLYNKMRVKFSNASKKIPTADGPSPNEKKKAQVQVDDTFSPEPGPSAMLNKR